VSDLTMNATDRDGQFAAMERRWLAFSSGQLQAWSSDFAAMKARQDALKRTGRWTHGPTDLLSIIGRSRWETYHSAILAWLLDPCCPHGLGGAMLRRLLSHCFPEEQFTDEDLAACTSATEVAGAEGTRLDILIRGPALHLVIEVKVDALEGDNQCDAYVLVHGNEKGARFIFLTPDGREPTSAIVSGSLWRPLGFANIKDFLGAALADATSVGVAASGTASAHSYLATLHREFR